VKQPSSGTFIATVKEFFPDASDDEAMGILWNYTGYPNFWTGEPKASLREQLQHLKDVGFEQVDRELDEALAE
jgi:hypothetical protein